MSEEDNFIARWSRRKREVDADRTPGEKVPAATKPAASGASDQAESRASKPAQADEKAAEPAIDLASLPPLDSITAGTDIRAFLQSGVPADLAKAALRRAWVADPAIRDFIEMAENQWDFANPASIPGFGPLRPTDDVAQLVSQALGRLGHQATAALQADPNPGSESLPTDREQAPTVSVSRSDQERPEATASDDPQDLPGDQGLQGSRQTRNTAVQQEASLRDRGPALNRRSHGGALPQ